MNPRRAQEWPQGGLGSSLGLHWAFIGPSLGCAILGLVWPTGLAQWGAGAPGECTGEAQRAQIGPGRSPMRQGMAQWRAGKAH